MKYLLKSLKIFLIVIVSVVIVVFIYFSFFYKPYSPGPESDEPLPDIRTKRERLFCDSLMSLNYPEMKINKRIYFDKEEEKLCYSYIFSYKRTPPFNENQADSINLENIRLITTLLGKYASDRMLYENKTFYIAYDDLPNSIYRTLSNKEAQKMCGFKVIKISKYKYKRIYNQEKSSYPKLIVPHTWIRSDGKYL